MTELAVLVGSSTRPSRDRGMLAIADRVVAKIAGRAASEIDGVEVPTAGGLGDLLAQTLPESKPMSMPAKPR